MRKYSVDEIDRMRDALEEVASNRNFYLHQAAVKPETIEARLRTYMVNGTDPEELEQIAKRFENDVISKMRAENDD